MKRIFSALKNWIIMFYSGIFDPDVKRLLEKRDENGLLKAIKHHSPDTRKKAAQALGSFSGQPVVSALINTLEDLYRPSWMDYASDVADAAADSLGNIKDPAAVDALLDHVTLHNTVEGIFFSTALNALIYGYKSTAVPALIAVLQDGAQGSEFKRIVAARVLGRIHDVKAIPVFTKIFSSDEPLDLRIAVVQALGELGDRQAIALVRKALLENNADMKLAAAKTLEELGWIPDDSEEAKVFKGIVNKKETEARQWEEEKNDEALAAWRKLSYSEQNNRDFEEFKADYFRRNSCH